MIDASRAESVWKDSLRRVMKHFTAIDMTNILGRWKFFFFGYFLHTIASIKSALIQDSWNPQQQLTLYQR